ncbi:regulator of chromosome condensation 1/beta-lactamase-inhibitor protein II, partial [Baffinella frigidus]
MNSSRPLPVSNTCVCAAEGFKATPLLGGTALECTRCIADEDCSHGYVLGTIIAHHPKLKKLSCGPTSCCAVDQVGDVLCWGDNERTRLGSNFRPDLLSEAASSWTFAQSAFPVQGLHAPAVAVAVSQHAHEVFVDRNDLSCAILMDGTVQCWGTFTYCVTDDGRFTIAGLPSHSTVLLLETGNVFQGGFACAKFSDLSTYCWGDHGNGRRMSSTVLHPLTANEVPSLNKATEIALGNIHGCAVLANEEVVCWGQARLGSLGNTT